MEFLSESLAIINVVSYGGERSIDLESYIIPYMVTISRSYECPVIPTSAACGRSECSVGCRK